MGILDILHCTACCCCQLDTVKFLMSTVQINPMSTNGNGDAPFHTACRYSKISLINRLYRCNGLEQTAKNCSQMAGNNYIY